MQKLGLNLLMLHNYTGGGERYASYVEPMIRIAYRNVVPEAGFDTSLTARWGYRPLAIPDFAFGQAKLFPRPNGAVAFGSRAAVTARTNEERYRNAQALISRVIRMAHARGIQVALGFEFGVYPPELYSVVPQDSYVHATLLPDPNHPASIEILHNTIDDMLRAYPDLDWICLWVQELESASAGRALAYIREAHRYIVRQAPRMRVAISGWGGARQLPAILEELDQGLPRDIVFTCLNPMQGAKPQPDVLAGIARHRDVWAIPWLEGDAKLWHPQPRVTLLRDHVTLARQQGLQGVIAIHWRTEDVRLNLEAFAEFARDPDNAPSVEDVYSRDSRRRFGQDAARELAPALERMDREHWFEPLVSPEYSPYNPSWGRLKPDLRANLTQALDLTDRLARAARGQPSNNLRWLAATFRFTLLLDWVGRAIEPAYRLREDSLKGAEISPEKFAEARRSLESAPVRELFETYASRVRSRGELGVLSSLHQRLWLQYCELRDFLARSSPPPRSGTALSTGTAGRAAARSTPIYRKP